MKSFGWPGHGDSFALGIRAKTNWHETTTTIVVKKQNASDEVLN